MSLYSSLPGTGRLRGFSTILSLLLLTALCTQARQKRNVLPQIIPRSHDVTAVDNCNRVPASESTGIADISIPLVDLHIGSFTLPITLRYHKNGLKVNEIPSSVGDGWSLHYGGMINYQQNGLRDFGLYGLFDGGASSSSMSSLSFFLRGRNNNYQQKVFENSLVSGARDGEFDQYHYNFLGKYGTYYLDTLMNVVTVPKTDIEIFRQVLDVRITDNENNNYYFTELERTSVTDSAAIEYRRGFDFISTYYLSRIVTRDNRTILFKYKKYGYSIEQNKSVITFSPTPGICSAGSGVSTYKQTVKVNCLLPDSIIFDQGFVKFNISTDPREDIKTFQDTAAVPSITGVSVFAGDNKRIKHYTFTQGYFDTNKRLKLSGVQEWNGATPDKYWQFNYYHEQDTFPALFTNDQDHWGYYNAANNPGLIPDIDYSSIIPGWNAPAANYGNRAADTAALHGMLQSIIYPTGGSSAFEYEPNQVRVGDYSELTTLSPFLTVPAGSPTPYLVGGLRLKTIITNDSTGAPSNYRMYRYADSLNQVAFFNIPHYIANLQDNKDSAGTCLTCGVSSTVFDESVRPLDAMPVVYSHVTMADSSVAGRQGKTESVYMLPIDQTISHTAPYVISTNTFWHTGVLLNKKIYALKDDTDLLIKEYRYTYNEFDKKYITTGVKMDYSKYCATDTFINNVCNITLSRLVSDRLYLLQTKEIDYLSGQSLTRQTDYTVNPAVHGQPTIVSYTNSKGERIHERTLYSFDYSGQNYSSASEIEGIRNLKSLNVLTPIEKIQYRTIDGVNYVTGATLTTYRADKAVPDKIYQLNLHAPAPLSSFTTSTYNNSNVLVKDSRYELITTFNSYDNNNNLLEKTGIDGIPVTYMYGYKNLYKIAEISSAYRTGVGYTSFDAPEPGNWYYNAMPIVDSTAPVGERCYDLSVGALFIPTYRVVPCVLTYWSKSPTPLSFQYEMPGTPVQGPTVNGWTFHIHRLSGPTVSLLVFPTSGIIDDLRIYPINGDIKTYTYQPHVGMISECDSRGNIIYYSYDETGRLKMVKNGDGSIMKLIDYQYQKPITQ